MQVTFTVSGTFHAELLLVMAYFYFVTLVHLLTVRDLNTSTNVGLQIRSLSFSLYLSLAAIIIEH